jgi:hypothetical protein
MTNSVSFLQMANFHLFSANRKRKFVFLGRQTVINICCFSKRSYQRLLDSESYWVVFSGVLALLPGLGFVLQDGIIDLVGPRIVNISIVK